MAYFKAPVKCEHYQSDWEALVTYVRYDWAEKFSSGLPDLQYGIEAKALSMFSIAVRIINAVERLADSYEGNRSENDHWKKCFVEATMMLFPMIELVGHARLGSRGEHSGQNLVSGLEWLRDPKAIPTGNAKEGAKGDAARLSSLGRHMKAHNKEGPLLYDLYRTRNYFIHGIMNEDFRTIGDILNYELPMAIVRESRCALREYWKQLMQDDGSQSWVINLSQAKIHPLIIQGSGLYDKGLIDPNILNALQ
jgi:hypothetical protein